MTTSELKSFLDEKVIQYNTLDFIESDPVQIPHLFSQKEDIEIAGFLSATIAWGNRKMIIKNSHKMMDLMGNSPYDFVMSHSEYDLERMESFVHRTYNGQDFTSFIRGLQHIYKNHDGLEAVFSKQQEPNSMQKSISEFKKVFFEIPHQYRTQKHISDPMNGSAAKRINMMLRWFCRQDNKGVDLGIWKSISPSILSCPLDVHSGNVARKLGMLTRKQNDGKALTELDTKLRELDPNDPAKYDFALFGLGVFEGFI
ncbi:TIGR02757 family protein [Flavobacterium cellulosilyticum]|uniref:TIGR02757 family protein n=1 Tax=Flavobacterium cellulosilyticum TaxID=2541731 RepID=A0A4R5CHV2_9FLAO|nr:TIGR02757 family protein [Flavobacterium cellulosilyticum]TDD98679.1 TIGR02757 family protein [Flavobacterium cellulosilyticum]